MNLIYLDGPEAPVVIVAERISHLEPVLERDRRDQVVVKDGVARTTGTLITLDTGSQLVVTDDLDTVVNRIMDMEEAHMGIDPRSRS